MAEHWNPTAGGFRPGVLGEVAPPSPPRVCLDGRYCDWSCDEHRVTYPPLTAEEFDDGCGYTINGIPLCEDEGGSYVYAHGHLDTSAFAAAVTEFDREVAGFDCDATEPKDVEHVWAVTLKPANDPDGWWVRWGGVTKDTPNAFAMTVVTR